MLTVKIEKELFVSDDNNFSICKAKIIKGNVPNNIRVINDCITIKGYFPRNTNLSLNVDGDWQMSKYGYQLSVTTFSEIMPSNEEGIMAFLTNLIHGVSDKTAKSIVDHFGTRTIEVFEKTPEELLTIRGIGRKKLDKMIESFNNSRSLQEIVSFLVPFGVSAKKCIKLSQAFGGNAINIIKEEPYRLCDIEGFGFLTVDEIAKHTTYNSCDPLRIRGAIKYVLESSMSEGHLCLHQKSVIAAAYLLLNSVDYRKDSAKTAIAEFIKNNNFSLVSRFVGNEVVSLKKVIEEFKVMALDYSIKGDNGYAYLPFVYEQEVESAEIISRRLKTTQKKFPESEIKKEIAKQEKALGIKLATKQVEAVILGVNNNTCIITGGPGVGKTTVLKVVLNVCEKFQRLTPADVMGAYEAIDSKIVVVDEASMVDQYICWCLLNAVPTNTKLIIIGDAEQLPSVGAGNVLYELLKCKCIPTVRLDVIYRQSGVSSIVINSDYIKNGITNLRYADDFRFIKVREKSDFPKGEKDFNEKIQNETADMVVEQFINAVSLSDNLDEVQVLCPMKKDKHLAGAAEINRRIQSKINPSSPKKAEIKKGKTVFREGDKVILTKNNYDLEWEDSEGNLGAGLFNGDIGYIKKIDKSDNKVIIDFCGKKASLDITQMSEIELAYAISIHKSQGSEYKTAIIPVISAFSIMLKRNLIYTGITRAKKNVILVGHQKAIEQSINTNLISKRNTQLGKRIKENIEAVKASA